MMLSDTAFRGVLCCQDVLYLPLSIEQRNQQDILILHMDMQNTNFKAQISIATAQAGLCLSALLSS